MKVHSISKVTSQPVIGVTKAVTQDPITNIDTQHAPSTMGSLHAAVMNPEEQAKIRLKRRVEDSQANLGS